MQQDSTKLNGNCNTVDIGQYVIKENTMNYNIIYKQLYATQKHGPIQQLKIK